VCYMDGASRGHGVIQGRVQAPEMLHAKKIRRWLGFHITF